MNYLGNEGALENPDRRMNYGAVHYAGKVHAGSVIAFEDAGGAAPGGGNRSFTYNWVACRLYWVRGCSIGEGNTLVLGSESSCYKTARFGDKQKADGEVADPLKPPLVDSVGTPWGRGASNAPFSFHGFVYDPDDFWSNFHNTDKSFSPYSIAPGSCYRKPADEDLAAIGQSFADQKPELISHANNAGLACLFYYEVWNGAIKTFYEKDFDGNVISVLPSIKPGGESERDYWLTVFFM